MEESSSTLPANLRFRGSVDLTTEDSETVTLVRGSSFPSTSLKQQLRRRGSGKTAAFAAGPRRQQTFSRQISHVAAETYLHSRHSFKLLSYLGVGYRWVTRLLALGLYAMFLMPGFLQVAFSYFFSSHIRRSIIYGDLPRNRLDLYLPSYSDGLKPVLIFVTGGAWIIGYKAWGSLLGLHLAEHDIIVACLDYRNFPQGTISDMVNDVSQGIAFICNNIVELGADPNKIYLMGQSAGAHISACALLEQAIKESRGESITWSVAQINTYFGLSGGYNLEKLVDHFNNRGLYRSIFLSIMEGEKGLEQYSPEIMVQKSSSTSAVSLLPHIVLLHGTADYSIPCNESKRFVDTLQRLGAQTDLILYEGKTHTDLFLQDHLRGGKVEFIEYLIAFMHKGDDEALARDAMATPTRRLVPEILLRLASQVSPF